MWHVLSAEVVRLRVVIIVVVVVNRITPGAVQECTLLLAEVAVEVEEARRAVEEARAAEAGARAISDQKRWARGR